MTNLRRNIGLLLLVVAASLGVVRVGGCDLGSIHLPSIVTPNAPESFALAFVRESSQQTPDQGRLITSLRAGEAGKYLAEKKHSLEIIDLDDRDENGQPAKGVAEVAEVLKGNKLPALVVLDPKSRRVLEIREIPPATTGAEFVQILKGCGG